MDKKNAVIDHITEVLKPYGLHDLEDVCERFYLDHGDFGLVMHKASILNAAAQLSLVPLGGEDSFGDLSWRIGPHHKGLPYVLVEMDHDGEQAKFSTYAPFTAESLERDFHKEGDNAVVQEYVDELLDDEDRADVWRYITEDAGEAMRCQEDALRLSQDPELHALLMDAIAKDNRRAVNDALDLGAPVNQADEQGNTPLHKAAEAGFHRLILPLLHAGAWVDEVNKQGQSPLHLAAARACGHGCLVLLAHNADPKRKDNRGRTPIPEPFLGYRHEPDL